MAIRSSQVVLDRLVTGEQQAVLVLQVNMTQQVEQLKLQEERIAGLQHGATKQQQDNDNVRHQCSAHEAANAELQLQLAIVSHKCGMSRCFVHA